MVAIAPAAVVLLAGFPASVGAELGRLLPDVAISSLATGREVRGALREGPVDIVVLDEGLTEPNAMAVVGALRADSREGISVLYCMNPGTGAVLADAHLERAGVDRLLFHPLDVEELAREVADRLCQVLPDLGVQKTDPREAMASALEDVWARAREPTLEHVARLEDAAAAAIEGRLGPAMLVEAQRAAHKLAGTAGMFGFPEVSRLAGELERLLEPGDRTSPTKALQISELAVAIRSGFAQAETPRPSDPGGRARRGLLLVTGRADLAELAVDVAEQLGLGVRLAAAPAEVPASAGERDLVLVDLGLEGAVQLVERLSRREPPTPVYALVASGDDAQRLGAVRAGVRGFVPAGLGARAFKDWVSDALRRDWGVTGTVLAVDDDPAVLEALTSLLEPAGMRVIGLQEPLRIIEALESSHPDIVVVDVEMPLVSGYEVCRLIRRDSRWSSLPVLFLTASTGSQAVHRVFAAGADDYVPKPVAGPELLTRVFNRLERTKLHRELADTDPLTGLDNRRSSVTRLTYLLHLSRRYQQPLSVGVLDLDHFKSVNDRFGHAVGDAVLRRLAAFLRGRFRGEDVVARWGGEEFVIGMYGMGREDGVVRLDDLLRAFTQDQGSAPEAPGLQVTFSAGVAEYPADGLSVDGLYRAAGEARYEAKAAGRSRVQGASEAGADRPTSTDVLVVEDDRVLADLLAHALETRGLRWERSGDGEEALALVVGATARLRPRVILLDVDLPGVGGRDVLRRLATSGVLRRTRVIMLTAHAAELDVLTALEEGAFDHVAKPFSIPVLMERIQRALKT